MLAQLSHFRWKVFRFPRFSTWQGDGVWMFGWDPALPATAASIHMVPPHRRTHALTTSVGFVLGADA